MKRGKKKQIRHIILNQEEQARMHRKARAEMLEEKAEREEWLRQKAYDARLEREEHEGMLYMDGMAERQELNDEREDVLYVGRGWANINIDS